MSVYPMGYTEKVTFALGEDREHRDYITGG
jgi:hypothetical protein